MKKHSLIIIALVACSLPLFLYLLKASAPAHVNPADLRRSIFDFATKNLFFSPDEGRSYSLLQFVECDSKARCTPSQSATNPTYAWAMLFLAQAKVEYKNSDPIRFEIASKLLDSAYNKWILSADGSAERFSLHQLYEAGEVTGEDRFTYWVRDRHAYLLKFAKEIARQTGNSQGVNAFLLSTLGRQLFLGLEATLNETLSSGQARQSSSERETNIKESFDAAKKIYQLSLVDSASGSDSNYAPLDQTAQGEKLPQTACFQLWSKTPTLKLSRSLTPDEAKMIPFSPQEMNSDFARLLSLLEQEKGNFIALQSIVPCIHALNEFRDWFSLQTEACKNLPDRCAATMNGIMPKSEMERLRVLLIERALLASDKDSVLCPTRGGFFSDISDSKKNKINCAGVKGIVDNSWLSYVLKPRYDRVSLQISDGLK